MGAKTRPRPFLVIGMGRSGTSYVGNVLATAGVQMGDQLKPPDRNNKLCYFEDLEVTRMHEQWLAAHGLTFASLSDAFPMEPTPEQKKAIRHFVEPKEAGRSWGLKAPGILFFCARARRRPAI